MINDLSSVLKNIDKEKLFNQLQGINGIEMFTKLGLSKEGAEEVMKGNFSPLLEKGPETYILDFHTISKFHGNKFNHNLIKFFFQKAKENQPFTENEVESYIEAFDNWFNLIFTVGKRLVFTMDEALKDQTVIIKIDDDYYTMFRVEKVFNQIFYLGKSEKSIV